MLGASTMKTGTSAETFYFFEKLSTLFSLEENIKETLKSDCGIDALGECAFFIERVVL
ncbi:hypothetical protein XF_0056 [Xylella fastidiosa 9a5c]|uniref:Uncharacterized protein n=2 Tax=Xylella fastidiosa TaxID=2371 RepID=Q9PH88_XYLFA|nr:hypothetical protein XF_0056 [Xylella fastidiosa 9a5c]